MHATSYLLKLQIDHVSLDVHGGFGVSKLIFGPLPLGKNGSYKNHQSVFQ